MPVVTLDASYDERHDLDPARPHNRESLVWVLTLPEQQIGVIAYTWVSGLDKGGVAGVAFGPRLGDPIVEIVDDIDVPHDMGFGEWHVGPIHTGHVEPLHTSQVVYRSEDLRMDFTFEAMHEPYAYATHPDGFPAFYADDRFEQGGRAHGRLVLRGEEVAFDGFCHRDHSWGARDWGAVTHYKWLNLLTPSASINVMDLQAYGRSTIRGYVFKGGATEEIVDARFEYDLDEDFFHRHLSVTVKDSGGRTTTAVLGEDPARCAGIQFPLNPRLSMVDLVAPVEIEGEVGAAYAEMAWQPEYLADRRQRR